MPQELPQAPHPHLLHEAIADIAYVAGGRGYYSGNSREDINRFISLAEQFEKENPYEVWETEGRDYMVEIEEWALKHLELEGAPSTES